MLRLLNVKIQNDIAQAEYTPEEETQRGFIRVDLKTQQVLEQTDVPGYEIMHPAHARTALIRMASEGDKRTERLVMWY